MQQPRWSIPVVWPVVWALGCGATIDGNKPLGTTADTDAELQRYLRRAYLDLSGHPPSDGELADATTRLRDADNTPAARGALVDGLIASDAFAVSWIGELESSIFGGATVDRIGFGEAPERSGRAWHLGGQRAIGPVNVKPEVMFSRD
jgi:hypothetical protein